MFTRTLFPTQVLIILLLLLFPAILLKAAEVQNVRPSQVGNRMLFEFDVAGEEPETEITVNIKVGDRSLSSDQLHLEGDFGKVRPGRGKKIYWNVLRDFPRGLDRDVSWEIAAGGRIYKDPVTGMEFIFVKGGCFQMGDTFGDGGSNERPVHEVCLNDFYLGKYEVTVGEFRKFVNETGYRTEAERGDGCFVYKGDKFEKERNRSWRDPGFPQDDRHPVVCVSWNDARGFADWLRGKGGREYRLPTEAEWEYAARSRGKNYKYSWGSGSPAGNVADLSVKRQFPGRPWAIWEGYDDGYVFTAPVGKFAPNELGLYDMTGNVWEWVSDWFDENYYKNSPKENPQGPAGGAVRALRGGSWTNDPWYARASDRGGGDPAGRDGGIGFRLGFPPQ
jgi:formylglycine-generating enzyme required for sulfatase activity